MLKVSRVIPIDQLASRQIELWEHVAKDPGKLKKGGFFPCITVSREIGSRGVDIANALGKALNWTVYDKELVEAIASRADVHTNIVEMFDEKTRQELNDWVMTILHSHSLSKDRYFKHLVATMASIGRHESAVIVGRGGNFIMPDETTLKVRIAAPLDDRITYVSDEMQQGRGSTATLIKRKEEEQVNYTRKYFRRDIDDPLRYDLFLNTKHLDVDAAAKTLIDALAHKLKKSRKSLVKPED